MGIGKQAKILSPAQQKTVLHYLESTRYPIRNKLIFLLSVQAGLRSKEIAFLEWQMVMDAEGNLSEKICLHNTASKGKSGRIIWLSKDLKNLFTLYLSQQEAVAPEDRVIQMEREDEPSAQVITNWFWQLYKRLGFIGASSHSGRRTAITHWAKKITSVGGSIRDVQAMAGHASLQMTQRYVEQDVEAQRKVVCY